MRIAMLFLALIAAAGCTSLKGVEYAEFSRYPQPERISDGSACPFGGPRSTQGHALCNGLRLVDQRQREIRKKTEGLTEKNYDLALMGIGVLSAAALAADSHESVLKTLGILLAGTMGLKNYSAASGRRSVYSAGYVALGCINQASVHLLWDESWFYRLRRNRFVLNEALSQMAAAAVVSDQSESQQKAAKIRPKALDSLTLTNEALIRYAAMGSLIEIKVNEILTAMEGLADSKRGDIGAIVTSIMSAQAVARAQNDTVQKESQEIAQSAFENTAGGEIAATAKAMIDVATNNLSAEAVGVDVKTAIDSAVNQVASTQAVALTATSKANLKLDASLAAAAYAMQEIANVAPRYVQASNDIQACVLK